MKNSQHQPQQLVCGHLENPTFGSFLWWHLWLDHFLVLTRPSQCRDRDDDEIMQDLKNCDTVKVKKIASPLHLPPTQTQERKIWWAQKGEQGEESLNLDFFFHC